MTREPASVPGFAGIAGPGRELAEDLVFHAFQARFLEDRVRTLSTAGEVDPCWSSFTVDVRAMVMARAMRSTADGSGDLCYPGGHAPGPALAFGATPLEFLRHMASRSTSPGRGEGRRTELDGHPSGPDRLGGGGAGA